MRWMGYTERDSKVGFWLRSLCSIFFAFTRALCTHNGRSLQTKKLRSCLAKIPTFGSRSVYGACLISSFCFCNSELEQRYLSGIRQLTFLDMGFEKAGEAYFSPNGKTIIFQAILKGENHFQIFTMDVRSEERRVGKECRSRWSLYHSKKI